MTAPDPLLLVEDDAEMREILIRALARRGYGASQCDNRDESLRLATERRFRAAVIDGNLNAQDGIVLVEQLRDLQPDVRAIVLSGQADQAAEDRALRAGACVYLRKPCSLAELRAAVESALAWDSC
jgi:ActR/RegA family two-component response regulator